MHYQDPDCTTTKFIMKSILLTSLGVALIILLAAL